MTKQLFPETRQKFRRKPTPPAVKQSTAGERLEATRKRIYEMNKELRNGY